MLQCLRSGVLHASHFPQLITITAGDHTAASVWLISGPLGLMHWVWAEFSDYRSLSFLTGCQFSNRLAVSRLPFNTTSHNVRHASWCLCSAWHLNSTLLSWDRSYGRQIMQCKLQFQCSHWTKDITVTNIWVPWEFIFAGWLQIKIGWFFVVTKMFWETLDFLRLGSRPFGWDLILGRTQKRLRTTGLEHCQNRNDQMHNDL